MLEHDVLGVIEDNMFPMNIHIIGRDHSITTDKKVSALEFREKLQEVLGKQKHITLLTPLVLNRDGKKMSQSDNTGLFLSQIKHNNQSTQIIINLVNRNLGKKTVFLESLLKKGDFQNVVDRL